MKTKKTINEVAELAKVSAATVSRVINSAENVKESTRERVYQAMREVGYESVKGEEILQEIRSQSNLLLAMVPAIGNLFIASAIEGVISAADNAGYECLIYRRKNKKYTYEELKSIIDSANPAGVIMMLPEVSTEVLQELDRQYPIVQCSEVNKESGLPYVTIDDYAAGKMATKYLIKTGRRRIAMINGPASFRYAQMRERGYQDALQEAGIEADSSLLINLPDTSIDSIYSVVYKILDIDNMPDAVFVADDVIGAILTKVAAEKNLTIPDDLEIIGFSNTYICRISTPTLTSVNQPSFRMGELAGKMLIERLTDVKNSHNQVELEVELVLRESTGV